jgi:hypothetical protein
MVAKLKRTPIVLLFALLAACSSQPRVRGALLPAEVALDQVPPRSHEFRIWVIVPELTVNTYPVPAPTQQPMLQFTGDRDRFDRGWGQMTAVIAPDEFRDGERVTYFDDKVLWTDSLARDEQRVFTLWLRENNRSGTTRDDLTADKAGKVLGVFDEIVGIAGIKIATQRTLQMTRTAIKQLEQDYKIIEWRCPWAHVLKSAMQKLDAGQHDVVLRARLVSPETVAGKPAAEVSVLFAVQKIDRPLAAGVGRHDGKSPE